MKRYLLGVLVFGLIPSLLTSQEADSREQTLRYGIETDVIALLGDLTQEKVSGYNDLLAEVISETRDPQILQGIFRLWTETSYEKGLPFAREEIDRILQDQDYSESVILSAIAFLSEMKDGEVLSPLLELVDGENTAVAASSVRAIGRIGIGSETASAQVLLERLEDIDRLAEDDLAAALISTLGELRYEPAGDELLLIVEDAGSSMGQRRIACIAVGKIGREEDYAVIERVFLENDDDAMFRSYALAGLAEFKGHDTTSILVQALKRDPFWRIRVTAAEKLNGNSAEGVQELLRYKAANDPIKQVRIASIKALASSMNDASHSFLLEYFADGEKNAESRLACLKALLENKIPGTIEVIGKVMSKLWEKDQGRFFEFTCRELSYADWPDLSPLYERMLDHDNWLMVVYAIRGIRRNGLALSDKIDAMNTEGLDERIQREINLDPR